MFKSVLKSVTQPVLPFLL